MKKSIFNILSVLLLSIILPGCSSDNFEISGELKDLGTQNLRLVYVTGDAVSALWQPAVDGKFTMHGVSNEPTVVEIFNRNMDILARVYIKNGDKITISGNIKEPAKIKVEGSDVNEQWSKFVSDNATAINKGDRETLYIAIEKYIRNNKDNILSSLLLAYNYATTSNVAETQKLLATIDEKAIAEIATRRIASVADGSSDNKSAAKKLASFILYSNADSLESFKPSNGKVSLLYFWADDNDGRKATIKELKNLSKNYAGKKVQIADITLENDSIIWKRVIKTDSVQWKQYWGLGGRMNNAIKMMGIENAPYFLVADSAGASLYRGISLDAACMAVDKKLKK
ncbi:MAG: DUF4369 domain-containing protein [Muribaculaceae bacterium]|nr:DUF4369 domain-containing protein [Muribaculaceae bacterium]